MGSATSTIARFAGFHWKWPIPCPKTFALWIEHIRNGSNDIRAWNRPLPQSEGRGSGHLRKRALCLINSILKTSIGSQSEGQSRRKLDHMCSNALLQARTASPYSKGHGTPVLLKPQSASHYSTISLSCSTFNPSVSARNPALLPYMKHTIFWLLWLLTFMPVRKREFHVQTSIIQRATGKGP